MSCEMCGQEKRGCRPAIIDGAKMMLCPDCIKHAEKIEEVHKPAVPSQKPFFQKPKLGGKDIYQQMEKELISNWAETIRKGREKKGITREELGFRIGERTVTIQKIENGDLRPSDKMITKFEKELGIHLLEEVKTVPTARHASAAMTLGDFIHTED